MSGSKLTAFALLASFFISLLLFFAHNQIVILILIQCFGFSFLLWNQVGSRDLQL